MVVDFAQQEQRDNARPKIASQIENIDDYDTILIGYPNWWGDMPMILYSFFDTYDLSGKIIAPFVTSSSSELSNMVNSIKEEEPDTTVLDVLSIRESNLNSSDDDITSWLEGMNLTK